MNWDLLFAIIFYGFILLFFLKNKKKFKIQAKILALYRTKLGLNLMDKIAKTFPRLLKFISYISISAGFIGMAFIVVVIIRGTYDLLFNGGAPALAPVLPGVPIPGLSITLGFWHWIIAIFFVAVVHEFSHGVFARLYNIKLKSSGFALFGPVLAAFVEPDEKAMAKKSKKDQLSILSAGPFSNLVWGVIFLLVSSLTAVPLENIFFESDSIIVNMVLEGMPAENAGLKAPFVIHAINGIATPDFERFVKATETFRSDKMVQFVTNDGTYEFKATKDPNNSSKGYVGIASFSENLKIKQNFSFLGKLPYLVLWFNNLIVWLFIINVGIGLFNLLPLSIVDGGRMFYLLALAVVKDDKKAKKIWNYASLFIFLLILINIFPYLWKLFLFLGSLIV